MGGGEGGGVFNYAIKKKTKEKRFKKNAYMATEHSFFKKRERVKNAYTATEHSFLKKEKKGLEEM